ncbi:oligopeptide ABC transporter substrate-binding protein [Oceanobacillus sp. J11TS1]|uniref:oligopeptide ABC transporter substrate-binding protein n=1 Tax=Oceanobacillus sp. J11TS1 TaxID=2807191 RepID=UPI001B01A042|nr:oligopeptide ABC transporter substrate-binding protein [Oceanobacillus sp. J11TS1]GIO24814.1 peptide ABC transporter substrate-binding protein [Oceanobacillus sp. J11TS1]
MGKATINKVLFIMMLMLFLVLAACSSGSDDTGDSKSDEGNGESEDAGSESEKADGKIYDIADFSPLKEGEPMDGGNLNFGLVADTVFAGTLNYNFYSDAYDSEVIDWFDEALLGVDETFTYTQDGAATWEMNDEGNEFTFTIRDEVNWHDGEPVTAEDWAFAIEVIADPDYDGVRYGDVTSIVGVEEYHDGKADSIEGLEIIDEKTLKMTFKQPTPSLLSGGIWTYALPKHIFEDIPVAEMSSSDAVRVNPIGIGPFKVESITPGESVTYTKNEDYWRGEPNLDSVTLKVIAPETVTQALETGEVDMVHSFPTDQYPDVEESLTNVEFLGRIDRSYTYIGFKMGTWDKENNKVAMDLENSKVGDVELRRAMWYAVDNNAVGERFYNGLRWNATTLIPSFYEIYHDDSIETPTYDPDKANQILDEAGYEDVDGDGIRENPDGEELVLNFASMSGGDTAEPLANYYIQAWEQVGIKVEKLDGRLIEFNDFYDRVGNEGNDDPDIDIYQGAWSVGTDVDPTGLWGPNVIFNYTRWEDEENTRLLEEGVSPEAMDLEYRKEVYSEWQEYMVEQVPVFPTVYRSQLVPVNKRVVNWDIRQEDSELYRYEVGVTQDEPVTP